MYPVQSAVIFSIDMCRNIKKKILIFIDTDLLYSQNGTPIFKTKN